MINFADGLLAGMGTLRMRFQHLFRERFVRKIFVDRHRHHITKLKRATRSPWDHRAGAKG